MIKKIKNSFLRIRELIWPLLEPDRKTEASDIDINAYNLEDDLDFLLKYAEKFQESEEKRIKDVESKSIIFIGTFGVAITVLINLTKDLVLNANSSPTLFSLATVFLMTLSIIYLCRAVWFSIKALERQTYYVIGFPTYLLEKSTEKKKKLLFNMLNATNRNSEAINVKVNCMTMAQEYFRRAIFVVAIFALIIMVKYFYQYNAIKSFFSQTLSNQNLSISFLFIVCIIAILLFQLKTLSKKHKG